MLPNGTAQVTTPKKKTNIGVIVGSVLGGVFVVLVVVISFALYYCAYKRRQPRDKLLPVTTSSDDKAPAVEMGTPNAGGARPFSAAAIAAATQDFKKQIGKGGFGSVYYGKLSSGQEVAVKVLDSTNSHQGAAEFFNEVRLVSKSLVCNSQRIYYHGP